MYRYNHTHKYKYKCICIFKGLWPPAAGPLSWILEHRWLVTAGWALPAGDCSLSIPSLCKRHRAFRQASLKDDDLSLNRDGVLLASSSDFFFKARRLP